MAPRTPSQRLRRGLLASAVALGLGVVTTPSCSTPFDPPNKIQALRVLSVEIDALALDTEDVDGDGERDDTIPVGSYVQPGESVRLKMQYYDGRTDLEDREAIQITWIGGCFNPEGDSYFNCYEPLGRLFQQVAAGEVEATEFALQGQGLDTFELKVPEDLLESREEPAFGPKLATAFVFFAACAGELRPVEDAGDTEAGAFPFGCFDAAGNRLGPDAFVPGYTVLYAYEDERRNATPVVNGFLFDGEELSEGDAASVERCDISEEERARAGCAATDEFTECTTYEIDVIIPSDVAERDPDSESAEGEPLDEVVWVNYYAEAGDFEGSVRLVNDAVEGYREEHEVVWVPPDEPGRYALWAIVRDSRGGSRTVQRFVDVE